MKTSTLLLTSPRPVCALLKMPLVMAIVLALTTPGDSAVWMPDDAASVPSSSAPAPAEDDMVHHVEQSIDGSPPQNLSKSNVEGSGGMGDVKDEEEEGEYTDQDKWTEEGQGQLMGKLESESSQYAEKATSNVAAFQVGSEPKVEAKESGMSDLLEDVNTGDADMYFDRSPGDNIIEPAIIKSPASKPDLASPDLTKPDATRTDNEPNEFPAAADAETNVDVDAKNPDDYDGEGKPASEPDAAPLASTTKSSTISTTTATTTPTTTTATTTTTTATTTTTTATTTATASTAAIITKPPASAINVADPDSSFDSDADANPNSESNSDPNFNVDGDADANPNSDSNSNVDADAESSSTPSTTATTPSPACLQECQDTLVSLSLQVTPAKLLEPVGTSNVTLQCRLTQPTKSDLQVELEWKFRSENGSEPCSLGPSVTGGAMEEQCLGIEVEVEEKSVNETVTEISLKIPNATPSESGEYACVVTVSCCDGTAHAQTVTKNDTTAITIYTKPRYYIQLAAVSLACLCLLTGIFGTACFRQRRRRRKKRISGPGNVHYEPVRLLHLPQSEVGETAEDVDDDDDDFDDGGYAVPSSVETGTVRVNPMAEVPLTPQEVIPPPPEMTSTARESQYEFLRPPSDLMKRLSSNVGFD